MSNTEIKVNSKAILKQLEDNVLLKMQRASKSFPRAGTLILQKNFEGWGEKDPIDTELSKNTSKVTSEVDLTAKVLTINLTIPTVYSINFRKGWGSNKKYGPRDPIQKAIPFIKKSIINQIKNS